MHSNDVIKGVDNHVTDRVQQFSYNVVEELGHVGYPTPRVRVWFRVMVREQGLV